MTRRGGRKDAAEAPRQARGRRGKRRASGGGAFLGLLMAAGLVFLWYGTEIGWENLAKKVVGAKEEEAPTWQPPSEGRVVEGEQMDLTPEWERDERWVRAKKNGEAGRTLMTEAVDRHFNSEQGDPFRFRAETEEASALLQSALDDLASLAKDLEGSDAAQLEIGKLQRRYGKILEDRGPKAR